MYKKNKILIVAYNFPPDQSPGSKRIYAIIKSLLQKNPNLKITVFTSISKRYGGFKNIDSDLNIKVFKFWVPYFGTGSIATVFSYSFFALQSFICVWFIKTELVFTTTAKLLSSFLATLFGIIKGAPILVDIRDTFVDNYFYFYRWKKRIVLVGLLNIIETFVIKNASSINLVSDGFNNLYYGWKKILKKKNIRITSFPNLIDKDKVNLIHDSEKKFPIYESFFQLAYMGNLGEGQDLYKLIKNLYNNPLICKKIYDKKIRINIYGSGSQTDDIKNLLLKNNKNLPNSKLSSIVCYKGLLRENLIFQEYRKYDCLFLQICGISSLSTVIPSKIFEYSATSKPILFSANGFTKKFINNIEGTIYYDYGEVKSFYESIKIARNLKVDYKKRLKFIKNYDSDIYSRYSKHILSYIK